MSKNYFTDEQVNAIHKEICRLEDLDSGISMPFTPLNNVEASNLRRICNLAVETAIGERLAYGVKLKSGMYGSLYNKEHEAIEDFTNWRHVYQEFEVLPFYKIQELEN